MSTFATVNIPLSNVSVPKFVKVVFVLGSIKSFVKIAVIAFLNCVPFRR